ncbi:hypothetical protein EPTV-WA-191 [Eptesipox virus]|uniref:Uncharacterized protein n=1 Tax=Eptesipox virus TaxID=1329402 RepID=A0A220T6Q8_9POXV|nr:hypothetical protein CG743_gp001 [Eptesipox virus]YP_009408142.1 hypothetical protein CG743_gp191 [Eptesipox virus]ASK51202.1 hypothetical protein EPTV-WA-001 [Eptesipox virus]ASK51392.1 hypothetical protein EPTV-WA-191 [Eptesipox virus]WAH70960.1 hypothetical protein CG743_gp001 [Eptesipox virus]WAH71150.1 hypothetical protein CG743_gp191 [Eptesipox virus]
MELGHEGSYLSKDNINNNNNNIIAIVLEYFIWVSKYDIEIQSKVFKALQTFESDAKIVFGHNYKNIVKTFNLDTVFGIETTCETIKLFLTTEFQWYYKGRTMQEACGIIYILAEAIKYWHFEKNINIINEIVSILYKLIDTEDAWMFVRIAIECRINKM